MPTKYWTTHYRGDYRGDLSSLCGKPGPFTGNGRPTCGDCKRISRETIICDDCGRRAPRATARRQGEDDYGSIYICASCAREEPVDGVWTDAG